MNACFDMFQFAKLIRLYFYPKPLQRCMAGKWQSRPSLTSYPFLKAQSKPEPIFSLQRRAALAIELSWGVAWCGKLRSMFRYFFFSYLLNRMSCFWMMFSCFFFKGERMPFLYKVLRWSRAFSGEKNVIRCCSPEKKALDRLWLKKNGGSYLETAVAYIFFSNPLSKSIYLQLIFFFPCPNRLQISIKT